MHKRLLQCLRYGRSIALQHSSTFRAGLGVTPTGFSLLAVMWCKGVSISLLPSHNPSPTVAQPSGPNVGASNGNRLLCKATPRDASLPVMNRDTLRKRQRLRLQILDRMFLAKYAHDVDST